MVRTERAFWTARYRAARGGRGRITRRHAGVGVGDPLSRPGGRHRRYREHARTPAAGYCLERDRTKRNNGRPGVAGGPLLGTDTSRDAGMGVARMVGHMTYLSAKSLRESSARGCSSPRTPLHLDRPGVRSRPLPAPPGGHLHQAIRREYLSLHFARTHLFESRAATGHGSLTDARSAPVQARTLLISFSSDWLYRPPAPRSWRPRARALGKDVEMPRHRRAIRSRLLPAGGGAPNTA